MPKLGEPIYSPVQPGKPQQMTKFYHMKPGLKSFYGEIERDCAELAAEGWRLVYMATIAAGLVVATYEK